MHSVTSSLRSFALKHDEMPAFKAVYITLVFLIAALLNLGFFLLLILLHVVLDVLKYAQRGLSAGATARATLRENIADLLLFSTALLFAVYLHHSAGIIALSGILQVFQTVLKAFLLLLARLGILLHILPAGRREKPARPAKSIASRLRAADFFCLASFALTLLFIAAAPTLLHLSSQTFAHVLGEQLVPWRV